MPIHFGHRPAGIGRSRARSDRQSMHAKQDQDITESKEDDYHCYWLTLEYKLKEGKEGPHAASTSTIQPDSATVAGDDKLGSKTS